MNRARHVLALLACSIGTAAALVVAPIAAADPDGGGGANNPLLPSCEAEGGNVVSGTASPGILGSGIGMGYGGFGMGWGY